MTTTIQLTQTHPSNVVLPLRAAPEEKIKLLLQEMKAACNTLPPPHSELMPVNFVTWENLFFKHFKGSGSTEQEKMQSANLLAALYFRVESLMLFVAVSDLSQLTWHKLCAGLKERLAEILPTSCPAEQFLATYRERELNKKYLVEIANMKQLFAKLRDQMYLQANGINEEMMEGFNAIQAKMIQVQDATDLSTEQIYEQMQIHTKSVTQLFLDFGVHMKEMKTIADLLKQHGITLELTLNESERVLNKV
jgi:hypothetical protein